jgi:hypothetical protein
VRGVVPWRAPTNGRYQMEQIAIDIRRISVTLLAFLLGMTWQRDGPLFCYGLLEGKEGVGHFITARMACCRARSEEATTA